jgi:hypothetical protein
MKTCGVCLAAMLLILSICYGQEKKYEEALPDIEWGTGSILLNSGEELKGLLRYNDRNGGVVSFESGKKSGSYTARSVSGFEFFDEQEQRQRVFYSLEGEDVHGAMRPLFFEVLVDFSTFAVLSKMDPVKMKDKSTSTPSMSPNGVITSGAIVNTKLQITQTETIYFMNAEGALEPYVTVTRKIVDREYRDFVYMDDLFDRSKMKRKFVDKDLLEKYFTLSQIESMEKFAEENELDFKVKDDLRKILASIK